MRHRKKIHMVGTTHFDPVWMWTWDEGMAAIRSTFRAALDRMREDEGFIYSFSCPAVFEWIRRVDRPLFDAIRARVDAGRWELVESWWVQPDCLVAAGESYVRHGLYGQRYLMEHFGRRARLGFNTDSFGHNVMMPQIYKKSGVDYYVFGRPSSGEKELPGPLFRWQSPDGSTILALRCGSEGANSYSLQVGEDIARLGAELKRIGHDMLMLYGVSNHGGAPTKQAIADINAAAADAARDYDTGFSRAADFFDGQTQAKLPLVRDELIVKHFGVFCNHTEVKHNNRRCEYALLNAERFALLAEMLAGSEYPRAALTAAWHDTLFNQFHDIIGGASVLPAYFDARNLHGRVLQTAGEIMHYALQTITRDINTAGAGFPLVVWNPNAFEIDTPVESELQWAWEHPWYEGDLMVTGPDGVVLPCQVVQESSALPRFRSRFVFRDKLPPLGYKVYSIAQKTQPAKLSASMTVTAECMENERLRVMIDQEAGCIASVYDKQFDREVLRAAAMPRVLGDQGDTWAFNIPGYGPDLGAFKMESVAVIESGPVRSVVRTKSRHLDSTIEQDIILYRDGEMIEGRFRVHWRETRRALKLCFTVGIPAPRVCSAVPYGSIERGADGQEMPAGEWLDLSGPQWGVTLLTDSIFSYDVRGSTAGLTVLRSPIYAHHGHPAQKRHIDESKDYVHMEQGCREGAWRMLVHRGDWRREHVPQLAAAFNNPVITIAEAAHSGKRPPLDSFLAVRAHSAMVTALKKSEDGDDLIVRLYEYSGARDTVKLAFKPAGRACQTALGHCEIKTLRLEKAHAYRAKTVNMLEEQSD